MKLDTSPRMDWSEVTDFVKILDWFDEPLFIKVRGLMDKTLTGSNIEIESVQTTSVGCNVDEILLNLGSNTVHVPGNEDWRHAFEGKE